MLTSILFNSLLFLFNNGGWGGDHSINADEIAGIGLGVAALIGAAGYLVVRRRSSNHE